MAIPCMPESFSSEAMRLISAAVSSCLWDVDRCRGDRDEEEDDDGKITFDFP